VDGDPGGLRFVPQHGDQLADPPVPDALVVPPPSLKVQDAARVPGHKGADPVRDRPRDDFFRGLMVCLPNTAEVLGCGVPLPTPVLAPAP
jgi:hypothetical protein